MESKYMYYKLKHTGKYKQMVCFTLIINLLPLCHVNINC